MPADAKRIYLVDGTSQLFRAYFALPPLTNREGEPTHAVYGFTSMMRKLIQDERPSYLAVAWDLPGETYRHETFPAYKANRDATPEDLLSQLPYAKQVCEVLHVPALELPGYEADDVIATLARQAREQGYEVEIVATDKDLLQLVGDGVRVLNPTKNEWLDREAVKESFGVYPEQVCDVQGLMGDPVDNIPGVPGVGEKTAKAVIAAYGDLDTVIERAGRFVALYDGRDALLPLLDGALADGAEGELPGHRSELARRLAALAELERDAELAERWEVLAGTLASSDPDDGPGGKEWKKRLRTLKRELKAIDRKSAKRAWYLIHEHAEQARMSKELATLHTGAPVTFDPQALRRREADYERAVALFRSLGFRALTREYARDAEEAGRAAPPAEAAEPAPADEDSAEVVLLRDAAALADFAATARTAGRLAVLPVTGEGPPRSRAWIGLALVAGDERAAYVPLGHEELVGGKQPPHAALAEALGPLLADARIDKTGHDMKALFHLLERQDMRLDGFGFDTMVAGFLLDPGRGAYPLDKLTDEFVRFEDPGTRTTAETPPEDAARCEGLLAAKLPALRRELESRLDAANLAELYRTMDGPLLPVLARMERAGIRIDRERLGRMSRRMESSLDGLRGEIHELAGSEFNVDSPKQLREVLFDGLGLKSKRKTAKSKVASTDAQTLEELADQHPIATKILEYREIAKLKGTYVDTLPLLVDERTGRVHTSYHPTGAATGRLSSSDPNLQNIPVRTAVGRRIREAFVPEPGCLFVASDYSQIELRILAHYTGDPELQRAFREREDIHRHTAALVAGVPAGLVSDEMRRRAKAVNFGILYGMSQTRLAREQGMTRTEAKEFIDAYFERFARVRRYIDETREQARKDGAVRTLFGRIRYFPQLHQRVHRGLVEQALRAAVNTPLQGTAADLMKLAMLRVDAALTAGGFRSRMLLQVHDELLVECPEAEAAEVAALVRREMERAHRLDVPLAVDQKTGDSWASVT